VAYLLLGLDALDLLNWTVGEDLAAGGAVLATLVVAWAISNRLRGVNEFGRRDDVGPEIREALAVRAAYRVARDTNETRELT